MCQNETLPWFYVPGIILEVILFFYIAFVIFALIEDHHTKKYGY